MPRDLISAEEWDSLIDILSLEATAELIKQGYAPRMKYIDIGLFITIIVSQEKCWNKLQQSLGGDKEESVREQLNSL